LLNRFATRRLIDASATLDPADRALLNIWVNRGLDDAALARMTGLSAETIAQRRARVIAHLSDELGLPPEHVRSALTEIAVVPDAPPDGPAASRATLTAPAEVQASVDLLTTPAAPAEHDRPAASPPAHPEPGTAAPPSPESPSPSRRRRRAWVALAAIVVIVAIVIVLRSGGSRGSRGSGASGGAGASGHRRGTTATEARASAQPVPSTAGGTGPRQLAALPGGLRQVTGTVALAGTSPNLELDLSVRHLPPPTHGHYEVWLYESLIYSEPLGRLGAGVTRMSVALPRDARRYPWLDVSFQPPGAVFHSGDSVLRAPNPLFASG